MAFLEMVRILGIRVDTATYAQSLALYRTWLTSAGGTFHQVATVNPEFVMEAQTNSEFRQVLSCADLALADGFGLVCAGKYLYGRRGRVSRVTGVQAVWGLAEVCAELGSSLYLIGAGRGIAQKTAQTLQQKFSNLRIAGAEEGILKNGGSVLFEEKENSALIARINAARPDVLLVAFGAPKQEVWISRYRFALPSVRIAVGVGGSFDYISGVVPFAPAWIRSIGMEWVYRLITQPHRLNRIITATVRFPLAVLLYRSKH